MRLTVLGGCGAWPAAGQACSGYLLEQDGFRLLVDPGYAIVPRLLELIDAAEVDAVLVSHGHPDHCADLHPLLRARVLTGSRPPALPVYALPGAVDRVLALRPAPDAGRGVPGCVSFAAGDRFDSAPSRSGPGSSRTTCRTPASGWRRPGGCSPTPATPGRARPSSS